MKEYEFHEYANKFRLMNKEEKEQLKEDIKKYNLLNPIFLFENKILDGRNRYNICKELEIEPKYIQFKGSKEDAFYFVISQNLKRRHLSPPEKADILLIQLEQEEIWAKERSLANLVQFQNNPDDTSKATSDIKIIKKKEKSKRTPRSIEKVAKEGGIGTETLRTAKKVKEMNDPQINKKWKQAKEGKTTIKAVKQAIDKKTKPKIIPKLPKDKYDIIYADPPWRYNFTETPNRTIEKEYPTMELNEIKKMKVPKGDNSVLFLWCTSPKLFPEGMEVMKAWGFTYKTSMVWVKDKIGMGYYARNRHELLLIGTKGKPGVPEPSNRPDSVMEYPRTQHSKKPKEVYELIEKMYPNRKYLELFARNERDNWKSWGNEV